MNWKNGRKNKKGGHVFPNPSRGTAPADTPCTGSTETLYQWQVGSSSTKWLAKFVVFFLLTFWFSDISS